MDGDIGTWKYDDEDDAFHWSDEARRLHDIPLDGSETRRDVLDRYRSAERSTIRTAVERTVERGDPFSIEVDVDGEDGPRNVRIRGAPIREDGSVVEVYGTIEDRSEQATLERRVEVLRDASQQLMSAETEGAVAQIMADASKNILGYVNTTIRLLDEDGMLRTAIATQECVEKAGERPDYPVDEETPASRTFRTGEPELHQDHDATADDRDRGELMSGLYAPIGDHGVMSAGDTAVAAFDESDVEAAELLGQLGAEALTRIESERELQAQNERLTEFIQEMMANIEEVTATTDTVEQLAADAVETANDGHEANESLADQMDDIESRVVRAAEEVEQLNEVVEEIDEFVDLIDDIAEQTNMLALNANIEAARAGEAGEGFAVVANEVKTLAEETGEATDQVESLIRNIERHSGRATESIRETAEYTTEGKQSAATSSELLGEIVEVITETKDGVADINQAMDKQARSIQEVGASLDE